MKGREQLARISRFTFKSGSSAQKTGSRFSYELLTLPLPFILWFITFIYPPFTFWPTLALSTALLFAVSLPRIRSITFKVTLCGVLIGVASGVFLYSFFWFGAQIAHSISWISSSGFSRLRFSRHLPNSPDCGASALSNRSGGSIVLARLNPEASEPAS